MEKTEPFEMSYSEAFWQNPIILCLSLRSCRKKNELEKTVKIGEKRIEKRLDVRSLIMTQNLILTMMKLLVKPQAKRKFMRI